MSAEAQAHHGPTVKAFIAIWVALLVLTGITVAVSYLELGAFNPIAALVIATCKALLVILFFMEVKFLSSKMTQVVIIAAFFWLLIMLALTMSDYLTRTWGTYSVT